MIAIDKHIPIPDFMKYSKWPFPLMQVGDSFVLPKEKYRSVINACAQQKKRKGVQFTVRKISDSEYRCWRVA